jgi:hypothetical protein
LHIGKLLIRNLLYQTKFHWRILLQHIAELHRCLQSKLLLQLLLVQ